MALTKTKLSSWSTGGEKTGSTLQRRLQLGDSMVDLLRYLYPIDIFYPVKSRVMADLSSEFTEAVDTSNWDTHRAS